MKEKKIKKSIDEESLVLFHRLITGLEFELLENLRFNEFETVKIIKPRLYLDIDTQETKKAVKLFSRLHTRLSELHVCTYMYIVHTIFFEKLNFF